MIIIFLGAPGSGKGTQSQLLADKLGLTHLSVGQLLREEYKKKTPVGLEGEKYWGEKGVNVPTRISFTLLEKYLTQESNVVLDNFPRTYENLRYLTKHLEKEHLQIDFVFHLQVDSEESRRRLLKRAIEDKEKYGQQRKDETEQLIEVRQKVGYEKDILPILEYFKKRYVLHDIDGRKSVEEVHKEIMQIIKNYGK